MPAWTAFAGFVGVVLAGLLFLSHASADALTSTTESPDDYPATLSDRVVGSPSSPTASLLLNVVVSQGVFALLLGLGVWLADIPLAALGLAPTAVGPAALGAGVALGVALHALNTLGSRLGERFGLGDSAALREALSPESPAGWAILLFVALPLVAGFEELLFRGILVGAFAAGFGVSPWLLAACSSVAFALGHGAQGRIGVVVTGLLGFVLAAAFVLTESLATVVLAHYLVNALEFVVNERRD
jgi:membrane protease YdiL (CAAX protease family)